MKTIKIDGIEYISMADYEEICEISRLEYVQERKAMRKEVEAQIKSLKKPGEVVKANTDTVCFGGEKYIRETIFNEQLEQSDNDYMELLDQQDERIEKLLQLNKEIGEHSQKQFEIYVKGLGEAGQDYIKHSWKIFVRLLAGFFGGWWLY